MASIAGQFAAGGRTFRSQEAFYIEACNTISSALRNDRNGAAFMITADWENSPAGMIPNTAIWWLARKLVGQWFTPTNIDGQPFPEPTQPDRPDPEDVGDSLIGLPPGAYDPDGASFYGVLTALATSGSASDVTALGACVDFVEALRLLGQDKAYVAACRCQVSVFMDAFDALSPVFQSDQHHVVVSPDAGRTGDPSVIHLAGAAVSPFVEGLPAVVMPNAPSPNTAERYRIVRSHLVFDYDRFTQLATADRRSPGALRIAFNGAFLSAVAAHKSSNPSTDPE